LDFIHRPLFFKQRFGSWLCHPFLLFYLKTEAEPASETLFLNKKNIGRLILSKSKILRLEVLKNLSDYQFLRN